LFLCSVPSTFDAMKQNTLYHLFTACLLALCLAMIAGTSITATSYLVIEEEEISEWNEDDSEQEKIDLGTDSNNSPTTKVYLISSKLFSFLGYSDTPSLLSKTTWRFASSPKLYLLFQHLKLPSPN